MTTRARRRRFIARNVDVSATRFLEIGAMDSPTFVNAGVDVSFLDWFSRDELLERHGENPRRNPERIVEVDHVVKSPRFSEEIDERFDAVIANHVLEHVPDAITWLQQLQAVTKPAGSLFLAIPDRNYTFDYLRPESTFVDLLRAHDLRLERADYYQVLSSLLYHRPIRAKEAWAGELEDKLARARFSVPDAIERARTMSQSYSGIHCHVFARGSFERLCGDLTESGLVEWAIGDIDDVQPDHNEFHVMLRCSGSAG